MGRNSMVCRALCNGVSTKRSSWSMLSSQGLPGTPEEVMFNIFRRINTGGLTLNGQEIRHALHKGPVRGFLKTLAASDEFQRATDYSVKTERMADRECVLRFMAFHIDPWEEYASNDLDGYLGT